MASKIWPDLGENERDFSNWRNLSFFFFLFKNTCKDVCSEFYGSILKYIALFLWKKNPLEIVWSFTVAILELN